MSNLQEHDLQQRYGRVQGNRKIHNRRWWIVGALAAAVLGVVWFTLSSPVGQLEYNDVGYTVESDTRSTVEFEVSKDPDTTAQCMLHMLDESYAIVGSRIVTIGPQEASAGPDRRQYFETEIRTEYRPVSGIVDSCWLVD